MYKKILATLFLILVILIAIISIYKYMTNSNQSNPSSNTHPEINDVKYSKYDPDFLYENQTLFILYAIKAYMEENNEKLSDFYFNIERASEYDTNAYVVHLWYATDYELHKDVLGNPSGKSRDLYYSYDSKKISKVVYWQ
jgi:hypothetical protein